MGIGGTCVTEEQAKAICERIADGRSLVSIARDEDMTGKAKARKLATADADEIEIYGLVCPMTGTVRYVGKSTCAVARLAQHLRETRRSTPLYDWIKSLRTRGLSPKMVVLATCSKGDWPDLERRIIAEHRKHGKLLNVADGGDEPHCPREVRAANGRSNARKIHDDPVARRMWKLKQQLGILIKRGHLSEATREKLRLAAKRHPDQLGEYASL